MAQVVVLSSRSLNQSFASHLFVMLITTVLVVRLAHLQAEGSIVECSELVRLD